MDSDIKELIALSHTLGRDAKLAVGTGGNTSVKTSDSEFMYIKASGCALKDMDESRGWRRLRLKAVLEILDDRELVSLESNARECALATRLQHTCDDQFPSSVRPSVESTLHALLGKCVVHLHALPILAYACAKAGHEKLTGVFRNTVYNPLWVPYANPGYELTIAVRKAIKEYCLQYSCSPRIIILQRHGVVFVGDSRGDVLEITNTAVRLCESGLRPIMALQNEKVSDVTITLVTQKLQTAIKQIANVDVCVNHYADPTILSFMRLDNARELMSYGPMTPDEMGFVDKPVVWLDSDDVSHVQNRIQDAYSSASQVPKCFLMPGCGLFVVGEPHMANVIKEVIVSSLFIRTHASYVGGLEPLTQKDRAFIENWEGEKFRVKAAERAK
jgi:rhamnose utilization protein RhaD (predicted bifunctional aldolase and dehydrogenase)